MPETKVELRQRMLLLRKALPPEERARRSLTIQERLLTEPRFQTARAIGLYRAMSSEVDTSQLAADAHRRGIRIAYPTLPERDATLVWLEAAPGVAFIRGDQGFEIPREGPSIDLSALALIAVPGVAFDERGGRLGRGGGAYDRALARLRPGTWTVGLAFALQLVDAVPVDAWDVRLDALVTEGETLRFVRAETTSSR